MSSEMLQREIMVAVGGTELRRLLVCLCVSPDCLHPPSLFSGKLTSPSHTSICS